MTALGTVTKYPQPNTRKPGLEIKGVCVKGSFKFPYKSNQMICPWLNSIH